MKTLTDFLEKFNISKSDFKSTGLEWKKLLDIKKDYESYIPELLPPANYIIDVLHKEKMVHSVRFRIKNPFNLIEKIVRKKIEEPKRTIDLSNYKDEITDLIGLRVLHLFKEGWHSVHNFIKNTWDVKEDPIAYYRKGDNLDYIKKFKENGCTDKEHPYGYRSVHYLITTNPGKKVYVAEIQVRTIFEEAWSEIDHTIRYPYDRKNQILSQFLVILNRLAGSADEMGSYVQYLKSELAFMDSKYKADIASKVQMIIDLKEKVRKLELEPKEEVQWNKDFDNILKNMPKVPDFSSLEFPKVPDFSSFEFPKVPDFSNLEFPKVPDFSSLEFPKGADLSKILSNLKHKKPKK